MGNAELPQGGETVAVVPYAALAAELDRSRVINPEHNVEALNFTFFYYILFVWQLVDSKLIASTTLNSI